MSRSDFGWFETLYSFNQEYVELILYQTNYQLLRGISRLYFQKSHPSHFISFILQGRPNEFSEEASKVWQDALDGVFNIHVGQEQYVYSDQQLQTIKSVNWDSGFSHEKGERSWACEYLLEYRANGDLDRIIQHIHAINHTQITYRKRQKGETLASITEQALSNLIKEIPKLIANQKFSEPLYCLQLKYLETPSFPPTILPGFEANRKRILEATKDRNDILHTRIWYYIWDFDEHEDEPYPPFPIDDNDTLNACEILQTEIEMKSRFEHGLRTLYQLAQALNQLNWSDYAPITSDFHCICHR